MISPNEAGIFGFNVDPNDFFRAIVMFLATYFGAKHGNGKTNGNGTP